MSNVGAREAFDGGLPYVLPVIDEGREKVERRGGKGVLENVLGRKEDLLAVGDGMRGRRKIGDDGRM